MTVQAFPLTWPAGFARSAKRERGSFKATLSSALANVQESLRRFGKDTGKPVAGMVISSNYSLGNERPDDPGVTIYFTWDRLQVCIPVDRYDTIAANLQAIHHIIEARRTELRHGTLALVRASFTGFAALPPPAPVDWRKVLKLEPTASLAQAEASYKFAARLAHPDNGGTHEKMAQLNVAIAEARRELGAQ